LINNNFTLITNGSFYSIKNPTLEQTMNVRNFSILAIITILVIITAVTLTTKKTNTTGREKLFHLSTSTLQDISEIEMQTHDETITLIRDDTGQWRVKEKQNYPAISSQVHKLLIGIADLQIIEAKTSNPEFYSKLGVENITTDDAKSTLLSLKTAPDKIVASLIVGNDKVAKIDSTRKEIYVRKPTEAQTWLTLGRIPLDNKVTGWLNKQILDIKEERTRQVEITQPDGEQILIFKNHPSDKDFQLADLPVTAQIKSAYTLKNIANTISGLNLDDVIAAKEMDLGELEKTQAIFTTFGGLQITMTTVAKANKHYATFSAAFDPQAVWTPPQKQDSAAQEEESAQETEKENEEESAEELPKIPSPEEIKTEVEQLNAQLSEWVYELAEYKIDQLAKKRSELIKDTALDEVTEDHDLPLPFATPTIEEPNLPFSFDPDAKDESTAPFSFNAEPEDELGTPVTE
jgi:hypothetical protein